METMFVYSATKVTPKAEAIFTACANYVLGADNWQLQVEDREGEHVLNLGGNVGVHAPSPQMLAEYSHAPEMLVLAIRRYFGMTALAPEDWLYLDIETDDADERWNIPTESYFRLGQYAWGYGEVIITTDLEEVREQIRKAPVTVAHNGHSFDWSVVFGTDSTEPLELARDGRLFDPLTHASLVLPAPDTYTTARGRTLINTSRPAAALRWFGLENLCYQLGIEGKWGDLKALAAKHGGFGLIPLDDKDYNDYARQDVVALRDLTAALIEIQEPEEYHWREQTNAAIDAQNSRNGFRVDVPVATARRDMLAARKDVVMARLVEDYKFPTVGKAPWSSKPGRMAITQILADNDIFPEHIPDWPFVKTGPSLGGKVLLQYTEGTPAEDLGAALAELMGQRSMSSLTLASMQSDGKVHPEIATLQRSGRKSTIKPGLTVWNSRGKGAIEKSYLIPDEGCVLVEFDYSQADARIVAALSGDEEYAKLFAPGADAHEVRGRALFGEETYNSNPTVYRDKTKPINHGGNYGMGDLKLSIILGISVKEAHEIFEKDKAVYHKVETWKKIVRKLGKSGFLTNYWGRRMPVEHGRSHTQSPALAGQSGTREIMVDALIRMLHHDVRIITWLKAQVHDALVMSIPVEHLDWAIPTIVALMETDWEPNDGSGQKVTFTVSHGEPSNNWMEASHG